MFRVLTNPLIRSTNLSLLNYNQQKFFSPILTKNEYPEYIIIENKLDNYLKSINSIRSLKKIYII